jgi:hypothetical protein
MEMVEKQPAVNTRWAELAAFVRANYLVEREWPGVGFVFRADGPVRSYRILLARSEARSTGRGYITIEAALDNTDKANLQLALDCATNLLGGLVCYAGFVSLRESRYLPAMSTAQFNATVGYLIGAAEGYRMTHRPLPD